MKKYLDSNGVSRIMGKVKDELYDKTILSDAVDLGLSSGTLWCSHNVGATNPEDFGLYFS